MNDNGKPCPRLTFDDAVEVWQLYREGWLQSRIAARFDVNQGRISEVISGKVFPGAREGSGSQAENAA